MQTNLIWSVVLFLLLQGTRIPAREYIQHRTQCLVLFIIISSDRCVIIKVLWLVVPVSRRTIWWFHRDYWKKIHWFTEHVAMKSFDHIWYLSCSRFNVMKSQGKIVRSETTSCSLITVFKHTLSLSLKRLYCFLFLLYISPVDLERSCL